MSLLARILNRASPAPAAPAALPAAVGGLTVPDRIRQLNRWREQYNPLRGLTLARAIALAEDFYRGNMADYQWACFFVEQTDPDLFALLEMRLGRIVEMGYSFAPERDADEGLAQAQAKLLTEKFALIDNLSEAVEHLALAPFRHYSHVEICRSAQGDIIHLQPVDQWNVVRDGLRGAWRYNPDGSSTNYASLSADMDLPAERFIFREVRRGINRIGLFKFIRSSLCEKDWDAFVEIFGFLGGVIIGPPNIGNTEAEKAEFRTAAERVAEGGSGYLPHDSDYKVNPTAKGAHPYKERLDHLTEKLVLVGTGGKLTMLTEAGSGTLAGGAHAAVFDQIAAAEAARISECLNRQLVGPLLSAAFPGQKQVVYYKLAANSETDTGAAVEEVLKLSQAGYQVEADEVAARTGWTVTIKPPAPASPFGGGVSPRVANRAAPALAVRDAAFKSAALDALTAAQRAAFAPLATRLHAVLALDEAALPAALAQLKADLPALYRTVLADPALAAAWEDIFGAALVSGAAEAAGQKKSTP